MYFVTSGEILKHNLRNYEMLKKFFPLAANFDEWEAGPLCQVCPCLTLYTL